MDAGQIGLSSYEIQLSNFPPMYWYLLATASIIAISDWFTFSIPNALTYPLIFLGLAGNILSDFTGHSFWGNFRTAGYIDSLIASAAIFLFMLFLHIRSNLGGGDVKFAVGIGAVLGLRLGFTAIFIGYVLASLGSAIIILIRLGRSGFAANARSTMIDLVVCRELPSMSKELREILSIRIPLGAYIAVAIPLVLLFEL